MRALTYLQHVLNLAPDRLNEIGRILADSEAPGTLLTRMCS